MQEVSDSGAAGFEHIIQQGPREGLHSQINGSQQTVRHQNEVSPVRVGDGHLPLRVKVGRFAVCGEALPAPAAPDDGHPDAG